ncbi:MAG TPA: copper resistance protein CopC [Nocardioidaceae bacterium]|nr:copper resistance protein CopC [Nocardioidaceae bacterium]
MRAAVLLLAFVGLLVGLGAGPSSAHAVLLRSDPPSGAVLATSPASVRLWFSEDIAPDFSSVRLVDQHGRTVSGTQLDSADPRQVELTLPHLDAGAYAVVWRVLAEDDGHQTSGTIAFSVGSRAAPPPPVSETSSPGAGPVAPGMRWLRLALLAGLVGPLAVALIVLGRSEESTASVVGSARRRLLTLAAICAALAVPVSLLETAVTMPDGIGLLRFVDTTRGSHLLVWQLVALAALAGLALVARSARWSTTRPDPVVAVSAGLLVAVLGVTEALRSHAASLDQSRSAALLADGAHVVAALLWLGALPALVVALAPAEGRRELVRMARRRFSWLAGGSILLVVLTGLYSAGQELYAVGDLTSTGYGRTLLVKAALVVVVGAIAVVNNAVLHGRRLGNRSVRLSRRLILVEAAVGATVLVAAALLAESVPAPQPAAEPAVTAHQAVASGELDDLVVRAAADPGRPGLNAFTVVAASAQRPAPAPITSAALKLSGSDRLLRLQAVGPDHYVATGRINSSGLGVGELILLRAGDRVTVPVRWHPAPVSEVADEQPQPTRLSDYTNLLALAIAGLVALALAGRATRRWVRMRPHVEEIVE